VPKDLKGEFELRVKWDVGALEVKIEKATLTLD